MRVLIAEDDAPLLSVLTRGLRQNGYVVDTAARGDDALHLLMVNEYAAAVLDWRMPGLSGIEVIAAVRKRRQTLPILLLTAHDTPADRIHGLDAGADDYVVKPFDFGELLARLRALLRRGTEGGSAVLRLGNLSLDPATRGLAIAIWASRRGSMGFSNCCCAGPTRSSRGRESLTRCGLRAPNLERH